MLFLKMLIMFVLANERGNTTSAAAIGTAQFGGEAKEWTGAGTGLDSGH